MDNEDLGFRNYVTRVCPFWEDFISDYEKDSLSKAWQEMTPQMKSQYIV